MWSCHRPNFSGKKTFFVCRYRCHTERPLFGQKTVSKKYLKIFLLISLFLTMGGGCTSFQHLTTVQEAKNVGPKAADCGSCHVLQFQEWSGSPHALAQRNSAFQEAFIDGGGEECLGCHAPLEIRQGNIQARSFNREEGVSCISCHLSQGRMHGPHKSSALVHPHPVQEEDSFYLSVELCVTCHGETYEEYQALAEKREVPTCLECHAAPRQRTATQGTNFFSNTLVAFEDEVETRSHLISLDAMAPMPSSIGLVVFSVEQGDGKGTVEIEIANHLPHNLPTGTFGNKSIQLAFRFLQGNHVLAENTLVVSNEQLPLLAGEAKRFIFSASGLVQLPDILEIRLERHASSAASRAAVILITKTISLPVEKM